jgi:hypothetical protein
VLLKEPPKHDFYRELLSCCLLILAPRREVADLVLEEVLEVLTLVPSSFLLHKSRLCKRLREMFTITCRLWILNCWRAENQTDSSVE